MDLLGACIGRRRLIGGDLDADNTPHQSVQLLAGLSGVGVDVGRGLGGGLDPHDAPRQGVDFRTDLLDALDLIRSLASRGLDAVQPSRQGVEPRTGLLDVLDLIRSLAGHGLDAIQPPRQTLDILAGLAGRGVGASRPLLHLGRQARQDAFQSPERIGSGAVFMLHPAQAVRHPGLGVADLQQRSVVLGGRRGLVAVEIVQARQHAQDRLVDAADGERGPPLRRLHPAGELLQRRCDARQLFVSAPLADRRRNLRGSGVGPRRRPARALNWKLGGRRFAIEIVERGPAEALERLLLERRRIGFAALDDHLVQPLAQGHA